MKFMKLFNILLIGITLVNTSCNGQKNKDLQFAESFRKELKDNKVQGASYAVFSIDSVIKTDNFGFTDADNKTLADASTLFNIGSVTKVFTAIAIMQLYEQGKLDIDRPIIDYVPDFTINQRFPESSPITIRSVLTHHAGLPGDYAKDKFAENPEDFHMLLQYLNSQSTCFPVNKIYAYSNLGYNLLGIVIERVSGENYEQYIKENIFEIAEMKSASFYKQYESGKSYSNGFDSNGEFCKELPLIDLPAGSIYASLTDMVKFGQSLLKNNSPLLKEQTKAILFEVQNIDVALDLRFRIAICLNVSNKANEVGRLYEHGGATMYHRADFAIAPDAGLGMVMLSNSINGSLNSWKLKEIFMVDHVKKNNLIIEKNNIPDKIVTLTQHAEKEIKHFEGWYATYGMVCKYEIRHDYLKTEIQGNSFYLMPHGKDVYMPAKRILGFMAKSKSRYFFMEEIDNNKLFIEAKPWGELVIIGQNFVPEPLSEKWKKAIGKYNEVGCNPNNPQMITNLELIDNNGLIMLRFNYHSAFYNKPGEAALQPIDELNSYIVGLGRNSGEQVQLRFENDNQIYLNFAGINYQLNSGEKYQ